MPLSTAKPPDNAVAQLRVTGRTAWSRLYRPAGVALMLACASGAAMAQTTAPATEPATPIEHLVILYLENTSFDSYFGAYPVALNPPGEPAFEARPGTPSVNGLTDTLLQHNPNTSNPFRIGRTATPATRTTTTRTS